MFDMFGFDFIDWGRYGVTDFDEGTEKALREAIESGEHFDTGWHGSVKGFETARICRDGEGITVSVYSDGLDDCMEQWDLFEDFLTDEEMERLTDEMVDQIRDYLDMGDFVQEVSYDKGLPYDASFEDVVNTMNELSDWCNDTLHKSFLECISTTLYILYGCPDNLDFIRERQKQFE